MRLLDRVVETPRPCELLRSESASLEHLFMLDVSPTELDALLERGWRRAGPVYFRPACAACAECVCLRIVAPRFVPTKSQRRAERACSRLRRVVGTPRVDEERLALYARWHAQREGTRGWEPSPVSAESYALQFAFPHPCAREATFYDDDAGGRMVGVGLFDETPRALSAGYFFHEPDAEKLSLGTANVLALVADARATSREHVYLGFRVTGCASLRYKARFEPHELLVGRPSSEESPVWQAPPSQGR